MENDLDFEFDFSPENPLSQNPAAIRKRASRANNPVYARLRWRIDRQNQRARQMGCKGSLTVSGWLMLLALYGGRCLCCGRIEELEIDHVIPLEKGGSNTRDNVQPLCAGCNRLKGRQSVDYRTAQAMQGGGSLYFGLKIKNPLMKQKTANRLHFAKKENYEHDKHSNRNFIDRSGFDCHRLAVLQARQVDLHEKR